MQLWKGINNITPALELNVKRIVNLHGPKLKKKQIIMFSV